MRAAVALNILLFLGSLGASLVQAHDCHYGCHHHSDCSDCGNGQPCDRACCRGARDAPGSTTGARIESFTAKVNEIVYLPAENPEAAMVEIRVRGEANALPVRLGPAAFLKDHGLVLREGDSVGITGFRVNGMDGDLFVATEVSKNGTHLALRDNRGRSTW